MSATQETVVAYNKDLGTLEYIGPPQALQYQQSSSGLPKDVQEVVDKMRSWIKNNERLSVKSIFASLDRGNFKELKPLDFERALTRIGISLNSRELKLLTDVLDQKQIGFIKYHPLVHSTI